MKKLLLILGAVFTLASCTRISPGSVGVKVNQFGSDKGVMDAAECTGFFWYNPIKYDIFSISTTIQHKEYRGEQGFTVNSSDGAEFPVNPIINYSINPTKAVDIVKNYYPRVSMEDLEDGFIKVAVYDAFRMAANSFKSDSLISNRETFERKVRSLLDQQLNKSGFIISQFTSNLIYPETFRKAIEEKNKMVQSALQAENEVKLAQANANIQIAKTTGEATSLKIQADADAYANKARQVSLTPLLIQQQWIEAWKSGGSQVPTYITGSASNFMFQMK